MLFNYDLGQFNQFLVYYNIQKDLVHFIWVAGTIIDRSLYSIYNHGHW